MPLAAAPDDEHGWGLMWERVDGARTPAVLVHPYGDDTEIELSIRIYRGDQRPLELSAGSSTAAVDGSAGRIELDLTNLLDGRIAVVNVLATAYTDDGSLLGWHGIEAYAWLGAQDQVVLVDQAEAESRVTLHDETPGGGVEVADLVGMEVTR